MQQLYYQHLNGILQTAAFSIVFSMEMIMLIPSLSASRFKFPKNFTSDNFACVGTFKCQCLLILESIALYLTIKCFLAFTVCVIDYYCCVVVEFFISKRTLLPNQPVNIGGSMVEFALAKTARFKSSAFLYITTRSYKESFMFTVFMSLLHCKTTVFLSSHYVK